jgi:hypothetical protein
MFKIILILLNLLIIVFGYKLYEPLGGDYLFPNEYSSEDSL